MLQYSKFIIIDNYRQDLLSDTSATGLGSPDVANPLEIAAVADPPTDTSRVPYKCNIVKITIDVY